MLSLREVINRRNFVVLDTETTGLERPAEICQIAIVGMHGEILLDTFVKPTLPIPPAAMAVHGITNARVSFAPSWNVVRAQVLEIIYGRDVIVYNAVYDRKLMHWSDEALGDEHIDYKQHADWHCAMQAYAEYHGEKHPYYGSYVWQRLSNACLQMGVETADKLHSALADAIATLGLIEACTRDLPAWQRAS